MLDVASARHRNPRNGDNAGGSDKLDRINANSTSGVEFSGLLWPVRRADKQRMVEVGEGKER